jgi:hypothetical protein
MVYLLEGLADTQSRSSRRRLRTRFCFDHSATLSQTGPVKQVFADLEWIALINHLLVLSCDGPSTPPECPRTVFQICFFLPSCASPENLTHIIH